MAVTTMKAVVCTMMPNGQEVILDEPYWLNDWPKSALILAAAKHDALWAWTYYGLSTKLPDMKPIVIYRGYIISARIEFDLDQPVGFSKLTFTKNEA